MLSGSSAPRLPAERRRLAQQGLCIDCGVEARPLRVTGPSSVRDRTHHRCHPCYRLWRRRRALWDRLRRARAHARARLVEPVRCTSCQFVSEAGRVGFWVSGSGDSSGTGFVCSTCHDDCMAQFGGLGGPLACVLVGDYSLFAEPVSFGGCALFVRHPPGMAALQAAAERLAHEFVSDFPFALRADILGGGKVPGLLEAYLHVSRVRFEARVLFPLLETLLVVPGARRIDLVFSAAVRREVAGAVYDVYGPAFRRRLFAKRLPVGGS